MKITPTGQFSQRQGRLSMGVQIRGKQNDWVRFGVVSLHLSDMPVEALQEIVSWLNYRQAERQQEDPLQMTLI